MLLKMRGGLDSIFVTVLLGVLIAAFAIWGIGPGILGGNQSVVAEVGSVQIGTQRYFRTVQNQALSFQEQIGGSMSTNELIRMTGMDQRVLQQLIAEAAVAAEASRLGLRATDRQVVDALKSIEGLRAPDGSLNSALLNQILISNGLTEQDLLNDLYNGVVRETMLGALVASSPVPSDYAKALYTYSGERRSGTLINIALEDVGEIARPEEDVLTAYFADRAESYKSPELRSYRYILVTPDQYASTVTVSEEDIASEYARRESEYVIPELRNIDQVSVPTRDIADAIIAAVANGSDFTDAAAANSSFTAGEISLGDQSKADVSRDFGEAAADTVFALAPGTLSDPIESIAGYDLFYVVDVTEGGGQTLSEVRDILLGDLRRDASERALFDAMDLVEDALADDPALDPIAEKFGFTVADVTGLDGRGATLDGVPGVTTESEARILREAYGLIEGDEPTYFQLDPNDSAAGYFILELTSVQQPADRTLGEVRSRVVADWTRDQRQTRAQDLTQTILARLAAGEEPDALVEELGGTSFEARNIGRTPSEGSSVAPAIRALIFELGEGAADSDAAADGNGYVIVRVDSITPGDAENAEAVAELSQSLTNNFVGDLLSQYQTYLLDQYPPSINQLVVQQLFDPANDQ